MRQKVTLPVLLLLLVVGQMSAEFCRAQCEGMKVTGSACTMHGMAHGLCASCKHASANDASGTLSALDTCSGQICSSVLGLVQNRPDREIELLVALVSIDILAPPVREGARSLRFIDARSTTYVLPFDPMISGLRI
jgi:hypothetical protein